MKNYNKMYDEPEFETAEFIEEVTANGFEMEQPVTEKIGVVNAREVYIRDGASTSCDHIGTVKRGEELIVLGHDGDFLKIETKDGVQAYIMDLFVDIVD